MTQSARLGERGVSIVSRVINEEFSWLFKRTHQEHDFGIDGYIDIISSDGSVTGQMLATQIKCGESFFKERTQSGYIYRGEAKHFNYLANHPVPVVIVICHPDTEHCYWVDFDLESCQKTGSAWTTVIPFKNRLDQSKDDIAHLLPPLRDSFAELDKVAKFVKAINDTSYIHFIIDRKEVLEMDAGRPRHFFDNLRRTKALAAASQGKVEFTFLGYESDPRELYEVDEIRRYMPFLDAALPELFFFVRTEDPTYTVKLFALCQTQILDQSRSPDGRNRVEFSTEAVSAFFARHWLGLNQMTEWLGMTEEENKKISFAIMKCLGFDMNEIEKDAKA